MTPSAVSHAVRRVEDAVGVPLFARTTRQVRLTEAGQALVDVATDALQEIDAQLDQLRTEGAARGAAGWLRLNVPRVALHWVVTPLLEQLAAANPDLVVEVFADDGMAEIVSQGFDAGIRLGQMVGAEMVAIRLTPPIRVGVVGSPAYLRTHGRPTHPDELAAHRCIGYRLLTSGRVYGWELEEDGRDLEIDVRSPVVVNDYTYALHLMRAGFGLGYVFLPLVTDDLQSGRLQRVLETYDIEEPGLFLYFPERSRRAPKVRALAEAARQVSADLRQAEKLTDVQSRVR